MGIFAGVMSKVIKGPVYVVQDNIDTDQIIPAQYLNLIPTIAEEYEKLGSYALCGLPEFSLQPTLRRGGKLDSHYPIVVAGRNFGCGSSREHAPIAMGSADCQLVLAESFARIFSATVWPRVSFIPVNARNDCVRYYKRGMSYQSISMPVRSK